MSLVTRCPACATAFSVVRDQLRISDGWVRCGRCSQVFDATEDLQHGDDGGKVPAPAQAPASAPTPAALSALASPTPIAAPASEPAPASPPAALAPGLPSMSWPAADLLELGPRPAALPTAPQDDDDDDLAVAAPLPARVSMPAHQPWFDESQFTREPRPALPSAAQGFARSQPVPLEAEQASSDAPLDKTATDAASPLAGAEALAPTAPISPIEEAVNAQLQKALRRERVKALRRERAEQKERARAERSGEVPAPAAVPVAVSSASSAPAPAAEPVTPLLEAPADAVSFANDPLPTTNTAGSRRRRVLWALAGVLALLALVLQGVRQERDTLLALHPELRPALQTMCRWTDCELAALRQIGSITIEGASFAREKEGEGFRLLFTLRNGARVPLAMPSIEVTLLDTQERAVVRRVLAPPQFGAPATLGAGVERNASLALELSAKEAALLPPVAGYRLLAFYP